MKNEINSVNEVVSLSKQKTAAQDFGTVAVYYSNTCTKCGFKERRKLL